MSQRVIVLNEAEDELIEAQMWYDRQRSGLGKEFRSAIDEADGASCQGATCCLTNRQSSPSHRCPASSGQTVSVFDCLH